MPSHRTRVAAPILALLALCLILVASPAEGQGGRLAMGAPVEFALRS